MAADPRVADIMELIDRLELQVTEGKRILRSNRVMVEEEAFLELIDMLRQAVPAEFSRARRVIQDRQKIVLDAQSEAETIVAAARDKAEYLISERGLTSEARHRSEDYLRQGRETSRRLMGEVDSYARTVFDEVERVMREKLSDIERAKSTLAEQP